MTPIATQSRPRRRPHVKTRKALQARKQETQRLTDEILQAGMAPKPVAKAELTDAELHAWNKDMEERLSAIAQRPEQNLGFIEEAIALGAREPLRLLAERAAQAKADTTPCCCPQCKTELVRRKSLPRNIESRYGALVVFRRYGWCPVCETWRFPADYALGLARNAPASPYVQEISALLVSKMPPEQAVPVAQRLGLKLSRCTLDREAHRQGLKAEALRAESMAQLDTWEGVQGLAGAHEGPPTQPFTLVIEIDAWNIRERDHWGHIQELRDKGEKVSQWHWVYMATVFRLDHRGQTAGDRAVISQRRYVSTRHGIDALLRQLYREAIDCGLGQTKDVLVIADGAVWIWNAVKDRFLGARQRLDLFHGDEHLWAVAAELHGKGTPEAAQWVAPLLKQIRADQTPVVIQTLQELQPALTKTLQEKVQTQIEYFQNNEKRMGYREIIEARKAVRQNTATPQQRIKATEPLGSGAIESTCRQYQCRFKRTGQFWTLPGDEALMCLETFWRNGRWHELFPHMNLASPCLN